MKIFISFLIVIFSFPLFGASGDTQKNLHTLFTTPHMRSQLNKQRMRGKFEIHKQTDSVAKSHKPIMVKMQGVVIRKGHEAIVFVNDSNTLKSPKVNDELVVKSRAVLKENYKVPVLINNHHIRLKPGQQWSESNQSVKEIYKVKPLDSRKQNDM